MAFGKDPNGNRALPREGSVSMRVLDASAGPDDKGLYSVRVNVAIAEGPDEGHRLNYSNRVDARSAPYVKQIALAVGWKGADIDTLAEDCEAWIKATGGVVVGEVAHQSYTDKKTNEPRVFAKIRSLGRGAKPLGKATPSQVREANEALRNAEAFEADRAILARTDGADDDGIPF